MAAKNKPATKKAPKVASINATRKRRDIRKKKTNATAKA